MAAEASLTSSPRRRRPLAAGAALYAAALGVVLFWPVHVDGRGGLFRFDPVLDLLGRFGIPVWASYPVIEFLGNAALFLPLGVLTALAAVRLPAISGIAAAGLLAAAISVGAELVQGHFIADRTMDPRDVIANAAGSTLGAVATVLVTAAVRRRSAARSRGRSGGADRH